MSLKLTGYNKGPKTHYHMTGFVTPVTRQCTDTRTLVNFQVPVVQYKINDGSTLSLRSSFESLSGRLWSMTSHCEAKSFNCLNLIKNGIKL